MTTKISNTYTIDGVVDTSKPVMANMQTLARAANSWVTFDIHTGLWSLVINRGNESSIYSFTDDNIIGSITISGTGLTDLYNKVEMKFPHKDLNDQTDYMTIEIPTADRFANEQENVLNLEYDCVSSPTQAQILASTELKQSRIDKIIQFRSDFTAIGLKAGDIIDITAEMYGYNSKLFRILTITEEDGDDNLIILNITAFEYDESVYNVDNLVIEERTVKNGIVGKCANDAVGTSDATAALPMDLSSLAAATGLSLFLNKATGRWTLGQGGALTVIDATSAVITWTFADGMDLDIRCRIHTPNVGQVSVNDYLGWTGSPVSTASTSRWPLTGTAVLIWGGDNTGVGSESVAVNIAALKQWYPSVKTFVIECRGNWYETRGGKPVQLKAELYEGGTLNPSGYTFTNVGYGKKREIGGLEVFIDSLTQDSQTLGDLMGYLVLDTQANTAQFVNDLSAIGISNPYA